MADERPMTLPAALARTAERHGTNPAYAAGGRAGRRSLTWAGLHEQATAVCRGAGGAGAKIATSRDLRRE
jgi:hypothetical protein